MSTQQEVKWSLPSRYGLGAVQVDDKQRYTWYTLKMPTSTRRRGLRAAVCVCFVDSEYLVPGTSIGLGFVSKDRVDVPGARPSPIPQSAWRESLL